MRGNYAEERAMTIWASGRLGSAMLALTLALVTGPVMAQAQQKVLRVVPRARSKCSTRINLRST